MAKLFQLIIAVFLVASLMTPEVIAKKKGGPGGPGGKGPGMGGMNGGPFGNKKMQMVFITVRDGYMDPKGIEKMAKDFQSLMSTGGIQVGIVGVDGN